jgi:t-SNARE complex subunit (syntaxin)
MNPMPGGSGDEEIIPPLAQLKVLKSLQAELNQRTEEFAKDHPDKAKLTEEELAELKDLEQAQREIATLFEQMAKLFQEQQPKQEKPEKPGNNETEKSP